jgi:hypothetical protein
MRRNTGRTRFPAVLLPRKVGHLRGVLGGAACVLVVSLVVASVAASLVGQPRVLESATAGPAATGLIQIPLRWCAVRGTRAVTNPAFFGEPDTNSVLWRRHERASDQVWIPGANITLRSAITAAVAGSKNFPVIDDPRPPSAGGPGQPGDILAPQLGSAEFNDALVSCNRAWDMLTAPPLTGPIALNIGNFVNAQGMPTGAKGLGQKHTIFGVGGLPFPPPPDPPCSTNPFPTITGAEAGFMGVVDFQLLHPPPAPLDPALDAKVVAHELGHIIWLGHGNGVDDPGTVVGRYDGECDSSENGIDLPASIMHPFTTGLTTSVTALQRGTARAFAKGTTGSQLDPPFELVNGDTVSDHRTDQTRDVRSASVDMRGVTMLLNANQERVGVSHHLYGLVSRQMRPEKSKKRRRQKQYVAFLDLDSDRTTGGRAAKLGFRTRFKGAELVTRVSVKGRTAKPTVWRFSAGSFANVTDRRVTAAISSPLSEELPFPIFEIVSAQLPADLVGQVGSRVRLQAITAGKGKGVDVLPGGRRATRRPRLRGSVDLLIRPPRFPACTTVPKVVAPGGVVTIKAAGFRRRGIVHVILGDESIANVRLNRRRRMSAEVAIPPDTRGGPRLITVGVQNTALTADCVLEVGR